ncbi:protein EIN4-like isoform X1 [Hibiscus syriacus]|uniref:protein EIN4-like isoform X1 n=1 Tax=Hibiscus syriacus TaxID=106335 RepID=UPI001924EA0A|nr:protein EIN4-like isoform X1 [Hibiscus syriacus]
MLKALALGLLISWLLVSVSCADKGLSRCNCDDEGGFWSIGSILETQRASDFLIAVAYFSIPIELLYFVSCSNVPFKWVLFQFIAFIVLCGLTHLLHGWSYGPHSFQLMLALTVFKILTALVSCATALSLLTLFPLLLKVKVRELLLKKKAWDLGKEVGIIMKQRETGLHVRMLTQEIRKLLDRHNILYTTMVELSKTLGLQNCAVWMPNEIKTEMNLTHGLTGRNFSYNFTIPITDPDVAWIKRTEGVHILKLDSALATLTYGEFEPGPVAAIRLPMLRICNFKGGTPEQVQTYYSILVCVLPSEQQRSWSNQELEIFKVVADQVAVAISHAAVLEESQLMREKLAEQNRALQLSRENAMRASQARSAFQKAMSDGMRRPMHSILGLLSMMRDGNLNNDQRNIVDSMMKTSNVLSTLINDAMDISTTDGGRSPLEKRSFRLHSMIKEAACLAKCLSVYQGFGFSIEVDKSLPDIVFGDERRIFQVILHMVGSVLDSNTGGGTVIFWVFAENGSQEWNDQRRAAWRHYPSDADILIRLEIKISKKISQSEGCSMWEVPSSKSRYYSHGAEERLNSGVCQKLVQVRILMHGKIWVVEDPLGSTQSMALVIWFQIRPPISTITKSGESSDQPRSNSVFRGLHVLLADDDTVNRAVTGKLLEKLGCIVSVASSGFECLSAIGSTTCPLQIIILELQMPELDGFEVATKIRKFHSRSWPLIVAMTASMDQEIWGKCSQTEMNGVIQKPVLLHEIAAELRKVLIQANRVG